MVGFWPSCLICLIESLSSLSANDDNEVDDLSLCELDFCWEDDCWLADEDDEELFMLFCCC